MAGIVDAALLAPAAVALTMQFGITNYVNFAFGSFLTLSAFLFYELDTAFGFNLWQAGLIAAALNAIAMLAIGAVVYGPFYSRRPQLLYMLVLTFVVSLMMDSAIAAIWSGRSAYQLNYPNGYETPFTLGPIFVSPLDASYVVISILILGATYLFLRFTRVGKVMRAVSDDRSLALVCGLPIQRTTNVTWLVTGFLGGIAGDILALHSHGFDTGLGAGFIYLVFAVVVFGGIGRTYGAVVGAIVLGLVFQLSSLVVDSSLTPAAVFAVLVVVMMIRPNGIFGTTGRATFVAS